MSLATGANQSESDLNLALALAESWAANHRIRPTPEQSRHVSGVLAAEVRRLTARAPVGGAAALDGSVLSGLNSAQLDFMISVTDSRLEVADYLRKGADVMVVPNTEVPEAPPFALDVVDNPSFWIGCFSTPEEAKEVALKLGLRVSE